MKKTIIIISAFLFIVFTAQRSNAQINRTLETKVADILAQLPTNDLEHSDKLMEEIISLNTEGILQFCKLLVPPGTGNDTQARYAIESLAIYSGGKGNTIEKNSVEDALLKALEKSSDQEIKTFLIERLQFCGTNASTIQLSKYLSDKELYMPTLATLTVIGTPEAANTILGATKNADKNMQPAFIDALGVLKFKSATKLLQQFANQDSNLIKRKSLMALAEIAEPSSNNTLKNATINANYKLNGTNATNAYIHYANRLSENGNKDLSTTIGKLYLKNCTAEDQMHFRAAAIDLLRKNEGSAFIKTLIKESQNQNNEYTAAVLEAASQNMTSSEVFKWVKTYKKASDETKAQIIRMLSKRTEPEVFENCLKLAVKDNNEMVRITGMKALAYQNKDKSIPLLFEALKQTKSPAEYKAIEETLLKLCNTKDSELLYAQINELNNDGKIVLINLLAARGATSQFDAITGLINNTDAELNDAIYNSLKSVSTEDDLPELLILLNSTEDPQNIKYTQQAIIYVLDNSKNDYSKVVIEAYDKSNEKGKFIPILPSLNDDNSLTLVAEQLSSENIDGKITALEALGAWKNNDAIPYLFDFTSTCKNEELHSKAFEYYLYQVNNSTYPDDQKLLLLKKIMPFSLNTNEKSKVIQNAQNIKTFLSLIFVSKYIDNKELANTASNAAIAIALSTPGEDNELSGDIVREIVTKSANTISGPESQYTKIDANEFLDNMSDEKGFLPIFNGKDLTGWKGLVKNPIERSKMSKTELAKAQTKANEQMLKDWFVKDGIIGFKGEGYNNICTIKDYGDFEMIVDWKITNGGDSGIYLRGTPQVQIWDLARVDVGAQVGSGGLYNNKTHKSIPLKVADNPINEWNTFRIKMVGERVTVYLNGVLVTDNVVLENYWDKGIPIFSKEAIELQAHGEDLGFRNVYVREINSGDVLLNEEEQKEGFKSLFNGKDLDHWIGNKKDYLVENNELVVRPKQGGHGNLYTSKEYSDFVFRFEFKLTPGANNGLGIHVPLEGDAAYVGKELQILDNTAAIYANLEPYQYHGSVYGIIAAKRGFLNPVGEWNYEEVIVKGDYIKITLNGNVIIDGNFKEASRNGTLDGKEHPGLKRNKGHIAFLGHGSELQFRNIRIKGLKD
ncbi:MAG: DUF1080 domain-containing protein [Bacteroidota bacterium]